MYKPSTLSTTFLSERQRISAILHTMVAQVRQECAKLADLGVQHVLVVVDDHIGKGQHVACQEVGAPALLAPKDPQILQSVHAWLQKGVGACRETQRRRSETLVQCSSCNAVHTMLVAGTWTGQHSMGV